MNVSCARNRRKALTGTVVSKSGNKTLKVAYFYKTPHKAYKKEVRRKTILHVHDEENKCSVGDVISVFETRPLSRLKRWRVAGIVKLASVVDA